MLPKKHLDDSPDTEFEKELLKKELSTMSKRQKFARLDELVVDTYIIALSTGKISPIELAPIITLLKNNKVVQDTKDEETESDVIDRLVDDK